MFVLSGIPGQDSPFGRTASGADAERLDQYVRLACLYEAGLEDMGAAVVRAEAPGIYHSSEALGVLGATSSSVHLIVRPICDVRPVYGLANYVVFDGHIDELDRDVPNSLRSGLRVLGAASGVFCTTSSLTKALVARGIAGAIALPPPISACDTIKLRNILAKPLKRHGQDSLSDGTIETFCGTARAARGQVIYWDSDEAIDFDSALRTVLDGMTESDMSSVNSCLIISGARMPPRGPPPHQPARKLTNIYYVEDVLDFSERKALAETCDILIRVSARSSFDILAVAAVASGRLTVIPFNHSCVDLAGSGAVSTYRSSIAGEGDGTEKSPSLASALADAMIMPQAEREARRRQAKQWYQSNQGIEPFAARLRARVAAP